MTDNLRNTPILVADDVHVTYYIHGGRRVSGDDRRGAIAKLLGTGIGSTGRRSVHAVQGVSLVANHGERIGLIGHNGAGKSTLLRALAGLMPLSGGAVYAGGSTSLLGVNAALSTSLTGEQNITLGGLAMGLSRQEVKAKFDDIVEFSGLGEFIHLPMRAYSSGMSARLRFAISTAAIPDVLMIDEALSTGDATFRKRSMAKMAEVSENAGTVFLVSHNAATVEQFCDRAIWLEHGQIVEDGPVDKVLPRYTASME
ncbi:MAG: ABC transporter ATP-binding protein [Actinomycetota bacterium]